MGWTPGLLVGFVIMIAMFGILAWTTRTVAISRWWLAVSCFGVFGAGLSRYAVRHDLLTAAPGLGLGLAGLIVAFAGARLATRQLTASTRSRSAREERPPR